jgi:hypothetical protein
MDMQRVALILLYDIPDSIAQNRPIYDVSRMNALRVPYYARLDAQMNKDAIVHGSIWRFMRE